MVTIGKQKAIELIPLLEKAKEETFICLDDMYTIEILRRDLVAAIMIHNDAPDWLDAKFAFPLTARHIECMCWVTFPEDAA